MNIPGKWIFRVGQTAPTGNVIQPDKADEEQYLQESCSSYGAVCHSSARCVDYEEGFCCECEEGFYGNGINCIKNSKVSFVLEICN